MSWRARSGTGLLIYSRISAAENLLVTKFEKFIENAFSCSSIFWFERKANLAKFVSKLWIPKFGRMVSDQLASISLPTSALDNIPMNLHPKIEKSIKFAKMINGKSEENGSQRERYLAV